MDDLLAQLETEFEPKQDKANADRQTRQTQPPPNAAPSKSMEQMLDELRADLESGRGRPNSTPEPPQTSPQADGDSSKYRDRLNTLIEQDYQIQARKREAKFAEIRKQEEARIAQEKRRQQELIEARQREELRDRRRKAALQEKAKQWLKKLNPQSEEGRWFEEFSYSYENKLQAAIDYLEAMRETGL